MDSRTSALTLSHHFIVLTRLTESTRLTELAEYRMFYNSIFSFYYQLPLILGMIGSPEHQCRAVHAIKAISLLLPHPSTVEVGLDLKLPGPREKKACDICQILATDPTHAKVPLSERQRLARLRAQQQERARQARLKRVRATVRKERMIVQLLLAPPRAATSGRSSAPGASTSPGSSRWYAASASTSWLSARPPVVPVRPKNPRLMSKSAGSTFCATKLRRVGEVL